MFEDLLNRMRSAGIDPTHASLIADGKLRRFRLPEDRPQSRNGYLTLFDNGDGTFGASFGSWKSGVKDSWFSGRPQRELTQEDRREFARKMAEARAKREREDQQRHDKAAAKAKELWGKAKPAGLNHPYLKRKQVKPYGVKQLGETLVIPVRNIGGDLVGLQLIKSCGEKRYLPGTAARGAFFLVGRVIDDGELLIAEGVATALSLFEATAYPCAVAFSAGNLKLVALALRGKYPTVKILICADADPVGRAAAIEAADAVNGSWVEPDSNESECQ